MELHPKEFHFPKFLEGIAAICRIRAEQKGIYLNHETFSSLPQIIRADEKRLGQVLMNLLSNAVKFTDKGGVTFKVELLSNNPEANQSAITKIRFQVEDTGVGIAPEQLEQIFLPFQQAGEHSRQTEGTGLGLAISRQLVQMMGSELKVRSILEKGSVFWLDLDLPEVSQWGDNNKVEESNIISFKGSKRKVLVVDDKWENRSVLVNLLEPLGFTVVEATNGLDGLSKAQEFQPDVIFMDLVMPAMDGFEATRRLRMSPDLKGVVIIAISASVFNFDRQTSQEAGCDGFLSKPIREQELLEKLRVYLGLEWVYEEKFPPSSPLPLSPASTQNSKLTTQDSVMVPPPQEEIAILFDLAMMGDLRGIVERAARLEELHQQWSPFATHLRQLAKGFKEKQILEFIIQYKRQ